MDSKKAKSSSGEDPEPSKKKPGKKGDAEDDKPQKKQSFKKADDEPRSKSTRKKDDEDEPRKKRSRSRDEEEDDDEDDEVEIEEDDEDAPEPEPPIEWTPRKRQLQIASNALIVMMVGCYLLIAYNFFTWLWIALYEMNLFDGSQTWGPTLFFWFSLPLLYLGLTGYVVSLVISLGGPPRVEGRAAIITSLVFAGIIYFFGILITLNLFGVLVGDPARAKRFTELLSMGSIICFAIGIIAAMAYLTKLMIFMKMQLESSQSITGMGFILMAYVFLLGLVYASPTLKSWTFDWLAYIIALVAAIITGFAEYTLMNQVFLLMKIRATITKYIKDE